MFRLKSLLRRVRVARALTRQGEYPKSLPNPELRPVGHREKKTIDELNSVCLFLGPYRNLTTLTASLLFLHPNCQVLNHAGSRILVDQRLNFLSSYTEEKFRDFCHFAITMSEGGSRGSYGGSIVLSHAFAEHKAMRQIFTSRFGGNLLKTNIRSLVWKESELVSQFIRSNSIDLPHIFNKNAKLRFLMPIRNPVSCAQSIVRYGMDRQYKNLLRFDFEHVLDAVLAELRWFVDLKNQFPDRFYYFYQDQLDQEGVRGLAAFLDLESDPRWIDDVLKIYDLGADRKHDGSVLTIFEGLVKKHFYGESQMERRLMEMVVTSAKSSMETAL